MGTTEVTQGTLNQLAKDVITTKEDLDTQISTMRSQLSSLQSRWMGHGGTAFTGAIQAWERSANRVTGAMTNFEANLKGTEATYDQTEDMVGGRFNKYEDGALG